MNEEIKIKEIELKIENLKLLRLQQQHNFRMEELNLRLEIATLMKSKGKKLRQKIKKDKNRVSSGSHPSDKQ